MLSFRVKKYSTLNMEKMSSTISHRSEEKYKNKSMNEFQKFMEITNFKLRSIVQKQQINQTISFPQEVGPETHSNIFGVGQQNLVETDIFNQTPPTNSNNHPSVHNQKEKTNRRNRINFQRNKEKFISQYGYIINKNKNNGFAAMDILVEQDKGQPAQRLLSGVQSMKIQKSVQKRPITSPKVNRSKKQQQNLNRIINQIEQNEQKQVQSARQKELAKIVNLFEPEGNKKHHLNVKNLINHLMRNSNKIYGRNHVSDSVTWCQDVLAFQIEDQYNNQQEQDNQYEKYKNFLQKLQRKRFSKRKPQPSFRKNPLSIAQPIQRKISIVHEVPFYDRKKMEQQNKQ